MDRAAEALKRWRLTSRPTARCALGWLKSAYPPKPLSGQKTGPAVELAISALGAGQNARLRP